MENIEGVECRAVEAVRAMMVRRADELGSAGLTATILPPKHSTGPGQTSSEIEIHFRAGDSLMDVLEFHVYQDGRPVADEAELADWLEWALTDVLRDRHAGMGGSGTVSS